MGLSRGELGNRKPSYLLFSPEPSTREQWMQDIANATRTLTGAEFEGNLGNAAALMLSFIRGRNAVVKGLSGPTLDVHLIRDNRESEFAIEGCVFIGTAFLERRSRYNLTHVLQFPNTLGGVSFRGTTPDEFELIGVEARHHAITLQADPSVNPGRRNLDPTAYDAQEIEFRALKFKLSYAQEQGMPAPTVQILQRRLDAATRVRRGLKA